jgi:hypothetical protein
MTRKTTLDKLPIYIPGSKVELQPIERLTKQGERKDRTTTL